MATQQGQVFPATGGLRRFVRAKMAEREVGSIKALQKLTDDAVTYASLYSFLTGSARTVERRTLVAVAEALDTPLDELITYTDTGASFGSWVWPTMFDELHPHYRVAVERMACQLLRIQRGLGEKCLPDMFGDLDDEP